MKIEEFRQYLMIDKMALDEEVVRQPSLFFEVAEAYAVASADREMAKEDLAHIDARLDGEIRKAAEGKVTEGQIKALVQLEPAHVTAFSTWVEAKEQADKLQALKDAFQQRAYILRDLVSLHNSSYFEESSLRTTASHDLVVYEKNKAKVARESK